MENIIITESGYDRSNISYLQNTLSELFGHARCRAESTEEDGRIALEISCPEEFFEIVQAEIADRAAEIIAVRYQVRRRGERMRVLFQPSRIQEMRADYA